MISSAILGLATLTIVYVLFKCFTRPSLSMIRGPESPSFIFGHMLELFQRPVGEADFAWQDKYGNIIRLKSVLGEDRLLVTDPKALQKIFNGYRYLRLPSLRVMEYMLNGKGIVWAQGEDHKRHKSIMLPGFGPNECKAFLPIFKDCAESISAKWLEAIDSSDSQSATINVLDWISRGALDAIGRAAFDVEFGTLQDDLHPLSQSYKSYFGDIFGLPSAGQIFAQTAFKRIPAPILHWIVDHGSNPSLLRARRMKATVATIAKGLVQEKADALLRDKGSRDILTLLVKANMDAAAKKRLSEEELYAEIGTLLIAGHETTGTTISFILLELARKPEVQSRLREEIRRTEAAVYTRGDSQLTAADLEAMPYLNAVIKEGLRLHPSETHTLRMASQDDILPLYKPTLTSSGDMISEVLVPKGTEIIVSLAAYNRNKDIWGADAHEFRPDRWLDGTTDDKKVPSIGVYSNLLTFLTGTPACIGWRFALLELQTFLSTLVGRFEFGMTDKAERIVRLIVLLMAPMVDGEFDRGSQLPLAVSLAPQDGGT